MHTSRDTQENILKYDVILTMFHDQGLPVIKFDNFKTTVNITLGLPIIRVSVDHGTALDLAGTGKVDISSFVESIKISKKRSPYILKMVEIFLSK